MCTTGCVSYTIVLRIISTTGCVSIAECDVRLAGVAYTMVLRIISTTGCVSISECMYDRLCCIHYGITYHFYYWLCINS